MCQYLIISCVSESWKSWLNIDRFWLLSTLCLK
ncbi:hypothetical protein ACFQGF_04730 [Microbulbifer taiwanensis]